VEFDVRVQLEIKFLHISDAGEKWEYREMVLQLFIS
jgi:hypothetical protein